MEPLLSGSVFDKSIQILKRWDLMNRGCVKSHSRDISAWFKVGSINSLLISNFAVLRLYRVRGQQKVIKQQNKR